MYELPLGLLISLNSPLQVSPRWLLESIERKIEGNKRDLSRPEFGDRLAPSKSSNQLPEMRPIDPKHFLILGATGPSGLRTVELGKRCRIR